MDQWTNEWTDEWTNEWTKWVSGTSLPRVNVFTDLFDDGLKSGTHCFDVDVNNIGDDAPAVLANLRSNPGLAEKVAERGARPFTVITSPHSHTHLLLENIDAPT